MAVILFILALNLFGVFEIINANDQWFADASSGLSGQFFKRDNDNHRGHPLYRAFYGHGTDRGHKPAGDCRIWDIHIFRDRTGLSFCSIKCVSCSFIFCSQARSVDDSFKEDAREYFIRMRHLVIVGVCSTNRIGLQPSVWASLAKVFHLGRGPSAGRGPGVFIDFTAGWCINCQVNDRWVLQSPDVIKVFKDKGISAFKADWTRYDPAITEALLSFGRDSIPVYVYYPPGSNTPIILPQLITPKMVVERINTHSGMTNTGGAYVKD